MKIWHKPDLESTYKVTIMVNKNIENLHLKWWILILMSGSEGLNIGETNNLLLLWILFCHTGY